MAVHLLPFWTSTPAYWLIVLAIAPALVLDCMATYRLIEAPASPRGRASTDANVSTRASSRSRGDIVLRVEREAFMTTMCLRDIDDAFRGEPRAVHRWSNVRE